MRRRPLAPLVELDYVVVGHVTRDLADGRFTIGGTVSYAARTALALGCRVGALTSAAPGLDLEQALDGVTVARLPAAATTTFENTYTAAGRRQVVHAVAEKLTLAAWPPGWKPAILHLGPVAQECDPALASAFADAFVGLTPQGWMRRWDRAGRVSNCPWQGAEPLLARADAVVLSAEDVRGDEGLAAHYADQTRLLVVTRGAAGCTVYTAGRTRHLPAQPVPEVDATGAGDVFAAALFVQLQRGGNPWEAARFANCVAARSVTRKGLAGTPTVDEVARCREKLVIRDV